MRQVVKGALGAYSCTRPPRHAISAGAKVNCLQYTKEILNWLKYGDAGTTILPSDEKYYTLVQFTNQQSDQIIWCKGEMHQIACAMCRSISMKLV